MRTPPARGSLLHRVREGEGQTSTAEQVLRHGGEAHGRDEADAEGSDGLERGHVALDVVVDVLHGHLAGAGRGAASDAAAAGEASALRRLAARGAAASRRLAAARLAARGAAARGRLAALRRLAAGGLAATWPQPSWPRGSGGACWPRASWPPCGPWRAARSGAAALRGAATRRLATGRLAARGRARLVVVLRRLCALRFVVVRRRVAILFTFLVFEVATGLLRGSQ